MALRSFPPQGVATPKQVADLQADVGDASGGALGSLYAIFGNWTVSILTALGYQGATALADKLTAARAALLDQITAARMAELDAANIPADIDNLKTWVDTEGGVSLADKLTAARATLLDRITLLAAGGAGELTAARAAALQRLIDDLTAARAALLDQITAARMAELDAANIPADIDNLKTWVDTEGGVSLADKLTAARAGYLDSLNSGVLINSRTSAFARLAGITQTFSKQITSPANAGDVTVATVTAQPCFIKRIVLRSNGATTGDLTSAAIYGGAGKVVTFIDATSGARANIAAADQQVSWTGAATFAATKTIVITLTGTGATAVDLQVDIEYFAIADGGYLA